MSQHRPVLTLTLKASAEVKPHRAVTTGGIHVATAGAEAFGVSEYGAEKDALFAVICLGTAKAEAGGAIIKGASVMADAEGKVITKTDTNLRLGIALEKASAAGNIIEVFLKG